jgi:hypothetical protein
VPGKASQESQPEAIASRQKEKTSTQYGYCTRVGLLARNYVGMLAEKLDDEGS